MKVEMKRNPGSFRAIYSGVVAAKNKHYENAESQTNEREAEEMPPEESLLSKGEVEEVAQVEAQDEGSIRPDSLSHLEREDDYEAWRVKLQPRKKRVDPEETKNPEVIVRLFKNQAVEEGCMILVQIVDIVNAHLERERMQEKSLPLAQGDPVELYRYTLDRILDDRFTMEDAIFELLNPQNRNEHVRDNFLQFVQGNPMLFLFHVSARVEEMQARQQYPENPDLFSDSRSWLRDLEIVSDSLRTNRAKKRDASLSDS
jgi:hypothetical protein